MRAASAAAVEASGTSDLLEKVRCVSVCGYMCLFVHGEILSNYRIKCISPATFAQAEYGERKLQVMAQDIAATYRRKGLLLPGDKMDDSNGSKNTV